MSTRANIGVGPLSKFKGFYVHDGTPDLTLPILSAWVIKNGFSNFVKVVDKTRGAGGSYLDDSLDPNSIVENPYDDGPEEHIRGRDEALGQEYTYIVNPDKIDIYNMGDKTGSIDLKSIPERKVIRYIFDSKTPKRFFKDEPLLFIGRVLYKEPRS